MTARPSAHELLAERLDRVRGARHIILRAPTGSGITRILAEFIARIAPTGYVLIVSSRQVLLDQWTAVLESQDVAPVRYLTPHRALELASRSSADPQSGIFLATIPDVDRGPVRLALQSLPLALLVLDDVPRPDSATLPAVLGIVDRARQTILVDRQPRQTPPSWLHDPSVAEVTLAEAISLSGKGNVSPENYPVTLSPTERYVLQQALSLLNKKDDIPSRPVLHSALMRLINEGQQPRTDATSQVDMAWNLVDLLEDLGPDPRLDAMTEAVVRRRQFGPVIVVTGPLRAEVEYVRDHLATHGIHTTPWRLQKGPSFPTVGAKDDLFPVIVAPRNGLDLDESLLQDAILVYFTEPRNHADRSWLVSTLHTGVARAAVLPTDGQALR
ncbi:DEAD/DEAH box helicase family protein [Verrucosispora sp. WMMC514]|uniref:DEAD/DEAH box helicase family protein n=1 Tax=Verrucosispora sp. WMMC514 TaxID=3015156 RepID=UPI00248B7A34|nr:DEAD/DEAH box helicase family protein [Verrucosispora sp. WMMC514]WBB93353.1 hypothetical protein O7597_10445 [Verrucosispora sp. WMMC514]